MTLQDFLAKITGQADRLSALETGLTEATQNLVGALATVEAKDAEIASLKAQLSSAPKPEDLTAKDSEITALKTERDTLKTKVDGLPQEINQKAAAVVAAAGHEQVNTEGNSEAGSFEAIQAAISAETNPHKRRDLFLKHKDAIAAHKASRQ